MTLHRRHVLQAGAALLLGAAGAVPWRAAQAAPASAPSTGPLRLGLAPYLSPAALLAAFRPVREHLQVHLGQPVQAYTARDFATLAAAVRAGDYDMALVPAHLARLAVQDWQWQPMAATVQQTAVLLLVRAGSPVRAPQALAGQPVGTLDPLALTTARATAWARAQGLALDLVPQPSINSALVALERGHLAAVVAAATQLLTLPPDTPRGQVVLAEVGRIPGPQYVARPGVPKATLARWQQALASFQPDPARPPSAANSVLTPLDEDRMAPLDTEAGILRQQLAKPR